MEARIVRSTDPETPIYLSIVIPAFNEAKRLGPTLSRLHAYLSAQEYTWEIVVVTNGCTDGTPHRVRDIAQTVPNLTCIDIPQRGKGIACRTGALAARGDILFLCDADLSMPPENLESFLRLIQSDDIVVGSREASGARRYHEPWHRHFMGRVFNRFVQFVAVDGIEDTQCGFKAFRIVAARHLFGVQRVDGFAFDVELLYLARKYGYTIQEVGIDWYFDDDTRVRPGIDTLAMVKELLTIRIWDLLGVYRSSVESPAPGSRALADNRPIGVFDSGVGGLTVLRELQERLPAESTIYLGDLARCPYGVRPQWQVRHFAEQIADYLAAAGIKVLVIACNTATAAAFHLLRDRYPFPVIGVIDPGARAAVRASPSGRIGVVATEGTVASGAYRDAVLRLRPSAQVVQRSASWLVPLIERGVLARSVVARELNSPLDELRSAGIDTLILGCTHFPLVRDIFELEIGPGVTVLDSAVTTVTEVEELLARLDIGASGIGSHRWLVTGSAEAFAERAQAMFRASPDIETIELWSDPVTRSG